MDLLILVFILGAVIGWIIEVCYKKYDVEKFINRGLLFGPYLPIYGFAAATYYLLSISDINIILKLTFVIITPIVLEFVAGIVFIKYYGIKLWDYSREKFNYRGIICLKFSIYQALLSLLGYYFIAKNYFHLNELIKYNIIHYLVIVLYLILLFDLIITLKKKVLLKMPKFF